MFPESFTFSIADWVNGWVDALVTHYGDVFRHISDTLLWAIVNLEGLLRMAPWWLMLAIVGGIAWHATRKLLTTAVIVGLLFLVGAVGLWDKLMQTLALMLVATLISVLIGIPLGILSARSNRLRSVRFSRQAVQPVDPGKHWTKAPIRCACRLPCVQKADGAVGPGPTAHQIGRAHV